MEQVLVMALDQDHPPERRGSLSYIVAEARYMCGDVVGAAAIIDDAVEQLTRVGDPRWIAAVHMSRATIHNGIGRFELVASDLDTAVDLAEATGNGWIHGYALAIRGSYRMVSGDLAGARADLEESLRTGQRIGLQVLEAQVHGQLVWVHLLSSPDRLPTALADARWHLQQDHALLRAAGNLEGLGYALESAAGLALAEARVEDAARALGAAEVTRRRLQMPAWPSMAKLHDAYVGAVRDQLGAAATDALLQAAAREDPWEVLTVTAGDPSDIAATA